MERTAGEEFEESSAARVYKQVRNLILSGEFGTGKPVSRRAICSRLRVGFLPVSEALQRLEYEGLLESKPRAGTRVRIPTLEDVRGTFVLREALESQVARRFVSVAAAEEKACILREAALLDQAIERGQARLFDYDGPHETFHRRVAIFSQSPVLQEAVDRLHAIQQAWCQMIAPELHKALQPNHLEFAKLLCGNDPEAADAAVRAHVGYGHQLILDALEQKLRREASSIGRVRRETPVYVRGSSA